MTIRQMLEPRFKWDDADKFPKFIPIKISLNRVFDMHDSIRARHAELEKDTKLSALGRTDAMRAFLAKESAPVLYRARQVVKHAEGRLTAWRQKLEVPPPIDKTDAAAAALRAQYRDKFAAMKPAEKSRWLHANQIDPIMYQAVHEMPFEMLRIDRTFHDRMVDAWIEQRHPGALQQIEDCDEAVAIVNAAFGVTSMVAARAGAFPNDNVFASFVEQSLGQRAPTLDKEAGDFLGAFGQ